MTDEQKNTEATKQMPPVHIGEDLDIDFWTLLEESRIIQAGYNSALRIAFPEGLLCFLPAVNLRIPCPIPVPMCRFSRISMHPASSDYDR